MTMTRQQMYGREFKILKGDSLTGLCEGAIAAGGGALATNTAMMCRPFCASGAGNPIISAHRSPFQAIEWDEVWFGYQGFTSEEEFLRSHGFFGSGRCYIVVADGGEKKLVALEDFVQLCPDVILGPRLKPLGHGSAVQQVLHQSKPAAASHPQLQRRGVMGRARHGRRLRPLRRTVFHGGRSP